MPEEPAVKVVVCHQGPTLKVEVNCLQMSLTRQLNEWSTDHWSATLESLDPEEQSLLRMT